MRKITKESVNSFYNRIEFKKANMQIVNDGDTTKMLLHGNCIATLKNGKLFISNCGWRSTTTKERLNGLNGVSISQKAGTWFLNGEEWDGQTIEIK